MAVSEPGPTIWDDDTAFPPDLPRRPIHIQYPCMLRPDTPRTGHLDSGFSGRTRSTPPSPDRIFLEPHGKQSTTRQRQWMPIQQEHIPPTTSTSKREILSRYSARSGPARLRQYSATQLEARLEPQYSARLSSARLSSARLSYSTFIYVQKKNRGV